MDAPCGLGDRFDAESLDALAAALGVRWPGWWPPFVLALAAGAEESRFWLPCGFIFASPRRAYEETVAFRTGRLYFSGAPSEDAFNTGDWPPRPLPERYVVVGGTGEGAVMVDTASDAALLMSHDKEGHWRKPLIDFAAEGTTPAEVARAILGRAGAG